MFSLFFIKRPIFATVIAIITVLVGVVALETLPIAQFPPITPPTVKVSAVYPGADARTVAETVGTIIEQQVNGVENMLYMSSNSSNDGSYSLVVTFEVGTDTDIAQVQVQNRVSIALPQLPEEVKRQGVTTLKSSPSILFVITLVSPDGQYDDLFLSNYAILRVVDELKRINGVGDVTLFGAGDYSMRVWLDPERLKARDLTTMDVLSAIQAQNIQVAAGQIGAPPAPPGTQFQYTVNTRGRFTSAEEFEDIILRTVGTRIVRLGDVARIEVGAKAYDMYCEMEGQPAAGIAVYQLPDANALNLAKRIRAKMEELKRAFPEGLDYAIPFDTTKFINASIHEVYQTLVEAGILVFLVIFIFLQDWRATLIPGITIPVCLIGTFAFLAALGYSINMLTLFGMVLAIGIVVDDAILVVENVWHHMETEGLETKEATAIAMKEIGGPIVAVTLVLFSVFLPAAFLPGITGQMYRQFALTIAAATGLSAVNALTLSPAMCGVFLRKPREKRFILFRAFNWTYQKSENFYSRVLKSFVRRSALVMVAYIVLAVGTGKGFVSLPTGFLPTEDQGYCFVVAQLPDAASQQRTRRVTDRINEILAETPGVSDYTVVGGLSIIDNTKSSNAASVFVTYLPWEERFKAGITQEKIINHLYREFFPIQEAVVFPLIPPAITGLGNVGGFQLQLQDRGGVGIEALQEAANTLIREGNSQGGLVGLNTTFRSSVPQLYVDIDRTKVMSLNIPIQSVFDTLQAYLGSAYANDVVLFGRTYQVRTQAEARFRARASDIRRLEVRNTEGSMIPLGTVADVREVLGPQVVNRYNLYPSAAITGNPAPGLSSGQALLRMEDLADANLPQSMGYEWTGMSFQERRLGSEAIMVFALAVVLVLLVLAAQYESWTNPVAVVLVVPLALLGTVIALASRGFDNNVYAQIGFVLIISLASKNAILIVEFARELRAKGKGLRESAVEAGRLRFRPILMTSFSFILGIVPLVVASGAGAVSRQSLGTTVFGGMIAGTILAVLFVPVFFVVFQGLSEWMARRKTPDTEPNPEPVSAGNKPENGA